MNQYFFFFHFDLSVRSLAMFREFDLVDEKKLTHCINQNHGNQKVANYLKFLQESQYHQTQSRYSTIENEAE